VALFRNETVDLIPILWAEPETRRPGTDLVLWMPGLSMPKENLRDHLAAWAEDGFVAVTFDAWRQGARSPETEEEVLDRSFGNVRKEVWTTLGQTTLDALRVLDWAIRRFGARGGAYAGGVSMGGDVAIAAAGLDARIRRVAAVVSTPDWARPGMEGPISPDRALEVRWGAPDLPARLLYEWMDPRSHLSRYVGGPPIAFECGAEDVHIRPEWAVAFREALLALDGEDRVRITLHPGAMHLPNPPAMFARCRAWFAGDEAPSERGLVAL
jgi:uncharacterized protein